MGKGNTPHQMPPPRRLPTSPPLSPRLPSISPLPQPLHFAASLQYSSTILEPHPPIYAKTFCSQACRDASACASCLSNIAIFLSLAKHSSQKPKLVRCPGALNDSALLIASSGDRLLRPRVRPHVCGRCLPWQAPQKIVMVPPPSLVCPPPPLPCIGTMAIAGPRPRGGQ